jgi:hypothetical protein
VIPRYHIVAEREHEIQNPTSLGPTEEKTCEVFAAARSMGGLTAGSTSGAP